MFIHTLRTLLAMLAALTTLSDDDDDCGVSAPASSSSQLVVAVPNIDSAISRTRPEPEAQSFFSRAHAKFTVICEGIFVT